MKAINAIYEAQKIAFAPFVFQTVNCLHDFGIFDLIHSSKNGLTQNEISEKSGISLYGVKVLIEMSTLADITIEQNEKYTLSKVGYFLARDEMTRVNLKFTQDVCYQGLFNLKESIQNGAPEGLKALGDWETIYAGLAHLEPEVKKSWFDFDHFYSDNSFTEALKIIFKNKPSVIFDIGGNTGKWATACTKYNPEVQIEIFDLPGQLAVAKRTIEEDQDIQDRVSYNEINVLDPNSEIKSGADVYWMSQFLDCFSEQEIESILLKIKKNCKKDSSIFIMETFLDNQQFPAAAYSLAATSLYFTAMANGNSKMYSSSVFKYIIEKAGFECVTEHHLHQESFHTILEVKLKN